MSILLDTVNSSTKYSSTELKFKSTPGGRDDEPVLPDALRLHDDVALGLRAHEPDLEALLRVVLHLLLDAVRVVRIERADVPARLLVLAPAVRGPEDLLDVRRHAGAGDVDADAALEGRQARVHLEAVNKESRGCNCEV